MSTLKVTNIQHPNAADPAIELDPVDGVVFSAASFDASAITSGKIDQARLPMKRIAAFTGDGVWTVPAGVTYAIAHVTGAGGGAGTTSNGTAGGASSVAFASGTVTAAGGSAGTSDVGTAPGNSATAGAANSGKGATVGYQAQSSGGHRGGNSGGDGSVVVAGAAVTPAEGISVTVGSGGNSGTGGAGGSGYVFIEYYE